MYLNYCRGLRFEEAPDYMYLRQLFRILFRTLNHQYDYSFDWTLLKQKAASYASGSSLNPGHGTTTAGQAAVSPAAGKRAVEKDKDKKERESMVRKPEGMKRVGEAEQSAVGGKRVEDTSAIRRPPEVVARSKDTDRKHKTLFHS